MSFETIDPCALIRSQTLAYRTKTLEQDYQQGWKSTGGMLLESKQRFISKLEEESGDFDEAAIA